MNPVENKADTFLRLIRRSQRGHMKVYLGYAAGVGKTYQMLLEGHRLKEEGIDVVVGLAETHGRVETEKLLEGLEIVPRRRQEYRGIVVEEMDVGAILARKPQVTLIDELAHTNVPGAGTRNVTRTFRIFSRQGSTSSRPSISNTSRVSTIRLKRPWQSEFGNVFRTVSSPRPIRW